MFFFEITFWPTITNFQCYNCESEAIYWCCWNAAYCSTECQQNHWHRWKFSQTDLPSSIRFEILKLHFVCFYSYCYWMAYIMYIICALQGTQEKLSEEALRAAKESEGEDCSPHTHVIWVFSCNTNNNNNNNKASANYHLKTPEWACQMVICRCGKVFSCSVFSQDWKKKDFPPIVKSGWSKHISNLRLALGGYVLRSYWVKTEHFLAVRHLRQAQTAQSIILLSS